MTAFAVPSEDPAINQATVYRYRLVNRGATPITDARASFFTDADLGNPTDDYVGTDVARGMAYIYNADNDDTGSYGYGLNPPAAGFDMLTGAGASSYFLSGGSVGTSDPSATAAFYNFQQGLWGDGTEVRAFGDGYGQTQAAVTRYAFPGDPVTGQAWSEVNNGTTNPLNAPGDRRFVVHSPAFDLAPGESHDMVAAVLYARGSSNLDSITRLRAASDAVQAQFDSGALLAPTPLPAIVSAPRPTLVSDPRPAARPPTLVWTPAGSGRRYRVEVSRSTPFSTSTTLRTYIATSASFEIPNAFFGSVPANDTTSVFWRVRVDDLLGGEFSAPSAARRFVVYRYEPGPLRLSDGSPAFVEVAAPGGGPPCATGAFGCAEVGGALVYRRVNPTGQYLVASGGSGGPEVSLVGFVPNEYEVRFTAAGSLAYHAFSTGRISRVPFEVWDIGRVVPGQPNDPSDDVRMVPVLNTTAGMAEAQECTFEFGDSAGPFPPVPDTGSARGATDWIYGYYPKTTYADWAAAAEATGPGTCPVAPATDAAKARIDLIRGRPIQRVIFQAAGSTQSVSELQGTVVRFYTVDGNPYATAAEASTSPAEALRLGAPAPNPFAASRRWPTTSRARATSASR